MQDLKIGYFLARAKPRSHLTLRSTAPAACLEGWCRARCLRPSFETPPSLSSGRFARTRWPARQDGVHARVERTCHFATLRRQETPAELRIRDNWNEVEPIAPDWLLAFSPKHSGQVPGRVLPDRVFEPT